MPIYEYHCYTCGTDTERLIPIKDRDQVWCLNCGRRPDRLMSSFSFKFYNPFTKDGEGFTSEVYSPKEADIRAKYNLRKDDKV